jgi:hypothetical protein
MTTILGEYKDTILKIKTGNFGHYLEWGEKDNIHTISLKSLDTSQFPIYHFTQEQAFDFIESKINNLVNSSQHKRFLRVIDPFTSIRYGKYGTYIFHKTDNMNKPAFVSLKKHKLDVLNACEDEIYSFIHKHLTV